MKKSINVLLYVISILFSLGQIGRLSFLGQQVNTYLYELPLVILTILLIVHYEVGPLKEIYKKVKPLPLFIIYFIGTFVLSSFFYSMTANIVGALYLARLTVYLTFFVYLWHHLQKEKGCRKELLRALGCSAALTIIFSVGQYFLYPNLRNISYLGWDPHWYRMVGTFFDPPISGAVFGLFLLFFLSQKKPPQPLLKWSAIAFFSICLILTYSRGTYLAALIVSLLIFFKKKLLIGLVLLVVIAGIIYTVLPRPQGESVNLLRTFSIFSRFSNYQEALTDWAKSPVIGSGYNRIRYIRSSTDFVNEEDFQNNHAGASYHSSFLIILVTGGVVGLGLFIWMLYSLSKLSIFMRNGVIFLGLLSLTDNVILHPFVLVLFILMGVTTFFISPSDTLR